MSGLGWVLVPGGSYASELEAIAAVKGLRARCPGQSFRYEPRVDDRGRKVFVVLQLR